MTFLLHSWKSQSGPGEAQVGTKIQSGRVHWKSENAKIISKTFFKKQQLWTDLLLQNML